MPDTDQQLSFNVIPHPHLRHSAGAYLGASIQVKVDVPVTHDDLQPGDSLVVTVSDADGNLLATAEAEVGTVAFIPIKDDGAVIGTERVHKAKLA